MSPSLSPARLLLGLVTHLLGDIRTWSDRLKDIVERPSNDPRPLVEFLSGQPSLLVSFFFFFIFFSRVSYCARALLIQSNLELQLNQVPDLVPEVRRGHFLSARSCLLTFVLTSWQVEGFNLLRDASLYSARLSSKVRRVIERARVDWFS